MDILQCIILYIYSHHACANGRDKILSLLLTYCDVDLNALNKVVVHTHHLPFHHTKRTSKVVPATDIQDNTKTEPSKPTSKRSSRKSSLGISNSNHTPTQKAARKNSTASAMKKINSMLSSPKITSRGVANNNNNEENDKLIVDTKSVASRLKKSLQKASIDNISNLSSPKTSKRKPNAGRVSIPLLPILPLNGFKDTPIDTPESTNRSAFDSRLKDSVKTTDSSISGRLLMSSSNREDSIRALQIMQKRQRESSNSPKRGQNTPKKIDSPLKKVVTANSLPGTPHTPMRRESSIILTTREEVDETKEEEEVINNDNIQFCEYSPLSLAVKASHISVIKILLENNVNPMAEDGTEISPYGRALLKQVVATMNEDKKEYEEYEGKFSSKTFDDDVEELEEEKPKSKCGWCCCGSKKSQKKKRKRDIPPPKSETIEHCRYETLGVKDKWKKQLSLAMDDKISNNQIKEKMSAARVVELLSTSNEVVNKRFTFGIRAFVMKAFFAVFFYFLFIMFTPLFGNYHADYESNIQQLFKSDFDYYHFDEIESYDQFANWIITNVLSSDNMFSVSPINGLPMFYNNTFMFGAIRLTKRSYSTLECDIWDRVVNRDLICVKGSVKETLNVDIPINNIDIARQEFEDLVKNNLTDPYIEDLKLLFNGYNPSTQRLSAIKIECHRKESGEILPEYDVVTGNIIDLVHAPSYYFDIALIFEIVYELYFKIKDLVMYKSFANQFRDGWLLFDWLILSLILLLLIYDFTLCQVVYFYYIIVIKLYN